MYADMVTAERIVDILHSTRRMLEADMVDPLKASGALDLVKRYMVWLYPPHVAVARANGVLVQLSSLHDSTEGRKLLIEHLARLAKGEKENYSVRTRSLLDEAIGIINKEILLEQISRGLQIKRLTALRTYGLVALALFLALSPLVANVSALALPGAPLLAGVNGTREALYAPWLSALGIAAIGALGGFLSALLQVRGSRVSLPEYLESELKAQLRPIVGALVALIVFVLLSWQIVPGIKIENSGSYVFFAFLSGFSERFFLRLLEVKSEETPADSRGGKTPEPDEKHADE